MGTITSIEEANALDTRDPPQELPDLQEQVNDITDEAAIDEENERLRRQRDAKAQALTLEIIGDLPYAEVKPPENVLFVCKLNPVTEGQSKHIRICAGTGLNHPQMRIWN